MSSTTNLRIESVHPLLPPAILQEEIPIGEVAEKTVTESRAALARILEGKDDRLVVVVGPCSIHDPKAALDYASKLRSSMAELAGDLCILLRVYFEKPRTTVGWKGLINDPRLDGTFNINEGLRTARRLLRDLNELGLACATEFLDPISPQFISGLISWGAIGARTTESQTHRELASGLSMPIGFKNGTGGNTQIAVDACVSSTRPHRFLGVTDQGLAAIVATKGNPHCHMILRGGSTGPNYSAEHVKQVAESMRKAGLRANIMVDCSHGNSQKDHNRQPEVARDIARQLKNGETALLGVMMESFLVAGNQELTEKTELVYGQSITDKCMDWDATKPLLAELAEGVRARRQARG
jgi:3-deoxy-7-phosphoheptulonate synthase